MLSKDDSRYAVMMTEDWQFIHVDPASAAKTAFGGTVAHGFLTLSMLVAMAHDGLPDIEGRVMGVNYGFDKIRFVTPVPSGSRVRARFKLIEVTARGAKEFMTRSEVVVEIDGSDKPALVAEWLGVSYLAETVAIQVPPGPPDPVRLPDAFSIR